MTTLASASLYKKEYLPGYTGHVPSKNERFGSTAGQIKREIRFHMEQGSQESDAYKKFA